MNYTSQVVEQIAENIQLEFDRLGVGGDADPYSGLSVEPEPVGGGTFRVKIYDDMAGGFYNGKEVLEKIKSIDKTSIEEMWAEIRFFEID